MSGPPAVPACSTMPPRTARSSSRSAGRMSCSDCSSQCQLDLTWLCVAQRILCSMVPERGPAYPDLVSETCVLSPSTFHLPHDMQLTPPVQAVSSVLHVYLTLPMLKTLSYLRPTGCAHPSAAAQQPGRPSHSQQPTRHRSQCCAHQPLAHPCLHTEGRTPGVAAGGWGRDQHCLG
jgi:hypothetical protein